MNGGIIIKDAYSKLCELESALANNNISDARRILAEAKGAVGDDGKTEYTFRCTKCKKHIPCTMTIPFSVIDTTMCIGGTTEGEFKLVEQHQNVEKTEVKKEVVEEVKEESGKEEATLLL